MKHFFLFRGFVSTKYTKFNLFSEGDTKCKDTGITVTVILLLYL